jgi:hypothetical protein
LVPTCIKCDSSGGLALKSFSVQIKLGLYVLPFLCGLGTFNDLSAKVVSLAPIWDFRDKIKPNSKIITFVKRQAKFLVALRFPIGYSSH